MDCRELSAFRKNFLHWKVPLEESFWKGTANVHPVCIRAGASWLVQSPGTVQTTDAVIHIAVNAFLPFC